MIFYLDNRFSFCKTGTVLKAIPAMPPSVAIIFCENLKPESPRFRKGGGAGIAA